MQIQLDDVRFGYGRTPVIRGVTWTISDGVTGLLGPNGAGKTTLLNLLVGLTKPDQGSITVDSSGPPSVGFMPQRFSLAGEMRVIDTVAYAAWVNGLARARCRTAAEAALAAVRLDDRAGERIRALSGGQRQRVGLAAALAHEPDVVVLDEPTVGLDPGQRLRLREIIAEIGRTRTVLLSTHLIEDISHLCNAVGVLADGQLIFNGTQEELAALIDATDDKDGVLGSDFERAYYALIERLGGVRD